MILVRSGMMVPAHDAPPLPNGALVVAGETIAAIGPYQELRARFSGAREIGGEDFLLIPGLINGHGHGRGLSSFQRGASDNSLESWIWETRKLIPIPVYDDVSFSALRLLKSGVTTTMHNHLLTGAIPHEEEFSVALKAYRDSGMRVLFCPSFRNQNPFVYGDNERFLASLPQNLRRFLLSPPPVPVLTQETYVHAVGELHSTLNSPMCRIGFGPLAPQWCTGDLLLEVRKEAERLGAPVLLHVLETVFQKIYGLASLGKTLIEYLNDLGLLSPLLTIGHCVWPTEKDIELLAKTGTGATHHPSSNLRLRTGIAPVLDMLQRGVRVGLGLDGTGINDNDDMIQEMKVCSLLHRVSSTDVGSPFLTARQVFRMATETNAGLLGFGRELGRLEPGCFADLVLLDYEKMCAPFVDPAHDPIDVLLYRGKASHVHTVMVNGRIVVKDGQAVTMNEGDVAARLAEAASLPRTDKQKALAEAMDELKQHVIRHYGGWTKKIRPRPYFDINSRQDGFQA
jgi:cytosine/adenosine deaminase-related metal-dependent hydrolase